MNEPLVQIQNLTIGYRHQKTFVSAVQNVFLNIPKGVTVGLVGESGCGKSTLALSLMGLLPERESHIAEGAILFSGRDLTTISPNEWTSLRGRKIAMIFQDPFSSLNPVLTIGYQLREIQHPNLGDLLTQVQLGDPSRILESYPHQLSGGQRQRVMIAMALARQPELLICDEPTTALDVTVQADIMTLLKSIQSRMRMSMLFITHNLGLVKDISDELAVMYAGQVIEQGPTKTVLTKPKHPYTKGLIKCLPRLDKPKGPIPVLEGQPPELAHRPTGCAFHPRCAERVDVCSNIDPSPRRSDNIELRCHLYPES